MSGGANDTGCNAGDAGRDPPSPEGWTAVPAGLEVDGPTGGQRMGGQEIPEV